MFSSTSITWRHLGNLHLLSRAKHPLTTMTQNEVCPRDEITDPPGTNVFSIDRYGFAEDFVSFCTLCGVYSAAARFAQNRRLEYSLLSGQARGESLCFLSASVGTDCSS